METVPGVKKIAVLRANALGDYIFSLPAFDSLRAAYPEAEIVLLGAEWHARVLPGRPGPVDRVVAVPDLEYPPRQFLDWARAERFDLALQLHGGGKDSNPVVRALGARVTAGLRAPGAPLLDRWIPYDYYQPEVFRYLEVVGLVGAAPVTVEPSFALSPADHAEARRVVGPPGPLRAALHPGATDPRRRWPPERFAAVGDALADGGAEVLVTGTGGERDLVAQVCAAMRRPARPLVDALSIGGLAAVYAGCAVVISNDTGPLHLAGAVGAGTVGLYWVGNMINGASPYRKRCRPMISWTIYCPECGLDCTRDLYPERAGGATCQHTPSFVADISVAEVEREALDLLTARRPDRAGQSDRAGQPDGHAAASPDLDAVRRGLPVSRLW
jgi:ADP-heptose:LPS heptosyltransferase